MTQEETVTEAAPIDHPTMVRALCKSGEDIRAGMTLANFAVIKNAVEMAINSADYLDVAKKQVIYNKPMSRRVSSVRTMPELTAEQWHLLHMAIGIFGEAGELLDAIAKHVFNGEPLDVENIIEECGDGEFYQEGFRQGLDLDRDVILQGNIDKLSVRYAGLQYSDSAAQERADKQEENTILPGGGLVVEDTQGTSPTVDESPTANEIATDSHLA